MDSTTNGTTNGQDPPVLIFSDGIPGFAEAHRFVLNDLTDDGTFQMLTCLDVPDLALVVMYPWLAFPDYTPELPDGDRRMLGIESPEDAVVFCSVIADESEQALHVNLRAPFVANAHTRVARQVLLDDEELPLRATVGLGT